MMEDAQKPRHKNCLSKRLIWFSIIIDVLILDQLSKWAVMEMIFRPQLQNQEGLDLIQWYRHTPEILDYGYLKITSFFNLVMAWNTGVSFSMFSNAGPHMPTILIILASTIAGLFMIWLWRATTHKHGICYALIIGGALGNIIDRIRFGAVIDFLDVHLYGYHWPAFNIADMAVVTGITMLIIVSLFFDIQTKDGYSEEKIK